MALNFQEVNCLGNIVNDTFGKSSTGYDEDQFEKRYGSYSQHRQGGHDSIVTKVSLEGDIMCITAIGIYNLGPINHQHQVIKDAENELNQYLNKKLTFIKNEFKKKENAGRALKVKEIKDSDRTLDVFDINLRAETRPAYIHRKAKFEVS